MPMIELHFPVLGTTLPADHGFDLYGALSRRLPRLHTNAAAIRIAPIRGTYAGNRLLHLDPRGSRLRLRLPAEEIPTLLPLAGKALDVAGHRVRLGVPQVLGLIPAPALIARLVVIKASSPLTNGQGKKSRDPTLTKRYLDPAAFLAAARRQLDQLGIQGEIGIPLIPTGLREGQPRRRVLRVKEKRIVGFSLQVEGLTAEESIRLQENGLGGRGKMGCGFFVPLLKENSHDEI